MKLFGINLNFGRRSVARRDQPQSQVVQRSAPYSVEDWLQGRNLDRPILTNAYQQSAWVYRAINVLAEQVANIPFLFSAGDRGRESLITTGPLVDFYNQPHPHLNRFQYWELRVIWLMLRGECFRVPIWEGSSSSSFGGESFPSSNRRRLRAIVMLDPAHFHHIIRDHQLVGWRYTGFGPHTPLAAQVFLPEEVWFERLPNPFDFWRGLPPLYAAAMAAHTDFAAASFMRGLIENNCDTGLIVRTDKPLADEQREQLYGYLRDRKRAAGVADRPLLLSGVSEIIKPELSSSDLQFLENRKFSRAEICAAFGVPEEILTATDHAKYDVMQGARLNFIENRVAPLCHRLEAEEERTVRALDPGAVGWFDLDSLPIMQQAQRNRLVTARTAFEMGVPFNELNRVFDLGFKRLPWGDKGYVTGTLQPVGESASASSPGDAKAGRGGNGKALETQSVPGPNAIDRALDWFGAAATGSQPQPGKLGSMAARKLRRFLFQQRGEILQKLASFREKPASPPAAAGPAVSCSAALALQNLSPADLFDVNAAQAGLAALFQTLNAGPQLSEPIIQRVLALLTSSIRQAAENHESLEQLADRIRAAYNSICVF